MSAANPFDEAASRGYMFKGGADNEGTSSDGEAPKKETEPESAAISSKLARLSELLAAHGIKFNSTTYGEVESGHIGVSIEDRSSRFANQSTKSPEQDRVDHIFNPCYKYPTCDDHREAGSGAVRDPKPVGGRRYVQSLQSDDDWLEQIPR